MKVTYFEFNKSLKNKYFDPQNYDLLQDEIRNIINDQTDNFEKTIIEFLRSRGYDINENATKEDYLKIVEKLKQKDKYIDYLIDNEIKEVADGFMCRYIVIPFFNSISSPIDEKTKEILLENWRKLHDKDE